VRDIPSIIPTEFSIKDITDELPKNKNYTWSELKGTRPIEELTVIVVHHTGMKKELGLTAESHARSHINSSRILKKGEPGIPYHIYIKDGQIYQVNDIQDFTYGVASNNAYTVHIAVEGNYTLDTLSEMDRKALYVAILSVKAQLPNFKEIKGHGEIVPTACPALDMDRIRKDVETLEQQIIYEQSMEYKKTTAYAIANNILYTFRLAQGMNEHGKPVNEETQHWALNRLLDLEPVMREKGFIK
jgi:hypothetical protein